MVHIQIIIRVSMVVFVVTQILYIIIQLRFDLGTNALRFASASNFETVPRFVEIW